MKNYTKKLISATCALSMALSITAFADAAPEWDYATPSPEGTQDSVNNTNPSFAFYEKYGQDNYAEVFYNGEILEFTDVYPLMRENTTFVPLRTFAEALNAHINYDDVTSEVMITTDETQISFLIGSNKVSVNDGTEIILPVNIFEIEGRTMVPVRLISEAFDLEVSWNEYYSEVSIMDINALKAGIDTDYTLINSFIKMQSTAQMDTNMMVYGDMTMELSSDGQNISVSADIETLVDKDMSALNYDLDVSIDFGELKDEMLKELDADETTPEEVKEMMMTYLTLLENFKLEYIFDLDELEIYIKSDLFDFFGKYILGSDMFEDNAWIKISYKDLLTPEQYDLLKEQLEYAKEMEYTLDLSTLIDLCLELSSSESLYYGNSYEMIATALDYVRDDKFVQDGNSYVLKDKTTIQDDMTVGYEFKLNTNSDKEVTSYSFDIEADDDTDSFIFSMSQESVDSVKMLFTLDSEVNDTHFSMEINLDSKETNKDPIKKPDSDNIIDIFQLIMG